MPGIVPDARDRRMDFTNCNSYLKCLLPHLSDYGYTDPEDPGAFSGVHLRIPIKWGCCVLSKHFPATGQLHVLLAPAAPTPTPCLSSPFSLARSSSLSTLHLGQTDSSAVRKKAPNAGHPAPWGLGLLFPAYFVLRGRCCSHWQQH